MATTTVQRDRSVFGRISSYLFAHPRLKLGATLLPPLGWIVIVYLAALGFLVLTSLWTLNPLTGAVVHNISLENLRTAYTDPTYRAIAKRTIAVAATVTLTDLVIAFPVAYYMARLAKPQIRRLMIFAVTMPLWINYLVKLFAWKTVLAGAGPAHAFLGLFGFDPKLIGTNVAVWLVLSYILFPFAVLPMYAAMERIPESLLEASGDLGARGWFTFRKVLFPLVFPGIVAASLFAFSLSLGDYITPQIVGAKYFLGNAIQQLTGIANNLPLAAAIATIPMVIMAIYMVIARRLGAFEAL